MRLIITLFIIILANSSFGQDCYSKYRKAFTERGSLEVTDSTYEGVIITVREGHETNCFMGKVSVKSGKVVLDNFYVELEDESYENLGPKFKNLKPVEIKDGISQIIIDKRDNLYNVIFLDHLKPKKKGFKKAPDFDLD
ncbi:MAG: hypothetical protein ACJASM_001601 [Salibacteraceae bacterium]|jgi:hypothetical protein